MKNWSKYFCRLGLAIFIYGISGLPSYGQQSETQQVEEDLKLAEVAETVKVYGKGSLGAGFTVNNYPSKSGFSPASIVRDTKTNPNPKVIFDYGFRVGLKKTARLNERDMLFDAEFGIDEAGGASIKKAFAESENWLLGYDISTFADADVLPNMLGGSPGNAVVGKAVQLRWKQAIDPTYSYAIAIEQSQKFDMNPGVKEEDKKNKPEKPNYDIPVLAGNVRYHYPNDLGHIQLGALGRALQYYNADDQKTYMTSGFGVNLGTKVNLVPEKTIFKASGVYGQGIGGYVSDLSALSKTEKNTVYLKKGSKELNTIDAWGVYGDIEYRFTPEIRLAGTVGMLSTLGEGRDDKAYQDGYFGGLKACYHPTNHFHVGLGYLAGARNSVDKKLIASNRIQFESGFSF